jgi:hypothetical protein
VLFDGGDGGGGNATAKLQSARAWQPRERQLLFAARETVIGHADEQLLLVADASLVSSPSIAAPRKAAYQSQVPPASLSPAPEPPVIAVVVVDDDDDDALPVTSVSPCWAKTKRWQESKHELESLRLDRICGMDSGAGVGATALADTAT